MAEMENVVFGEPVAAEWGNEIRDRTVQRYANAADLAALNPTPLNGDLAWLLDVDELQIYDGAAWLPYARSNQVPFSPATAYSATATGVNVDWAIWDFTTEGPATLICTYTAYAAGPASGANCFIHNGIENATQNRIIAASQIQGVITGTVPSAGSWYLILRAASVNQTDQITIYQDPFVNTATMLVLPT